MSDPVRELKRELLAAAERQQGHAVTARTRSRRWFERSDVHEDHRRRRLVALAAAVLVVVVGTASAFGSVRDFFFAPGVNSKIAFQSVREGRSAIYVMNANGSGQRRMAAQGLPIWSPDGRTMVFQLGRGLPPNVDLYVMNADGSGLRRLTRDSAHDGGAVWSPDGRKIAFDRNDGHQAGVHVMNVDGSGERNLTGDDRWAGSPTWSLDGRKIAIESVERGSSPGIYVMNADGSDLRRLTRNSGGGTPRWSPDGRRIAFLRQEPPKGGSAPPAPTYVYVMNADGSGPRRLARLAGGRFNLSLPSWSPDGKKIVFVSERDGNFEVHVVNADGSGQRNLTRHPGYDGDPAWSPDGRKVAFVTKRDGNFEVYVMNADGSGQRNLTRNLAPDRSPVWSPGRNGG